MSSADFAVIGGKSKHGHNEAIHVVSLEYNYLSRLHAVPEGIVWNDGGWFGRTRRAPIVSLEDAL